MRRSNANSVCQLAPRRSQAAAAAEKKPAGKSNVSLFRFSDDAEKKKKTTFCSCCEVGGDECSFKVSLRVFNWETDVGIRGRWRE